MHFLAIARVYRDTNDFVSLRNVWTILDSELNRAAETAWQTLAQEEPLAGLHREVAWVVQALIEFVDLADFTPTVKGPRQYKNYLYFEAISALRESTLGILNGMPRASIALLRSVMEMFLLHCWWHTQMERKGSSRRFYDWIKGQGKKPNFNDVVNDNLEYLGISTEPEDAKDLIRRVYSSLCSYVHAPIHDESITKLNGGNVTQVRVAVWHHWLELARESLRIALEHLVHLKPQCLFPFDTTRKFGFNPPVGMYFDAFNIVPLKAVLGDSKIESYRARFREHELVQMCTDVYESRPDLTDEQILASWKGDRKQRQGNESTPEIERLLFDSKAEMRCLAMALTYSDPLNDHW